MIKKEEEFIRDCSWCVLGRDPRELQALFLISKHALITATRDYSFLPVTLKVKFLVLICPWGRNRKL
jgi:hypothetical protein